MVTACLSTSIVLKYTVIVTHAMPMLDVVQLTEDVPDLGLSAGQTGTIVEVFTLEDFLVEFSDARGQTLSLPVLHAAQLKVVWSAATQASLPEIKKLNSGT